MNIGANTFGLKYDLFRDFDGTLRRLKEAGFTAVEICGTTETAAESMTKWLSEEQKAAMADSPLSRTFLPLPEAAALAEKIRSYGLIVDSAHVGLPRGEVSDELVDRYVEEIAAFSRKSGIRYIVTSPMIGLTEMKELAPYLQRAASALKKRAVFLMIHNHDMECKAEEGTTAIEYALDHCPDLYAEPDTGWMVYGGMDPVPFMKKYGGRIIHLHLKDFKKDLDPEDKSEDRFAAIGEGILPLQAVLEAKKYCSVTAQGLIIDQDASTGDFIEDLKKGRI